MAQLRTAAFAAWADASYNEPVVLVRVILSSPSALTKYLATRAGTYGGQAYKELLKDGLTLRMSLGRFGEAERSVGQLVVANEDDLTGVRFSDLLGTHILTNAEIQVDQLFRGMGIADALRLFKGTVQVPEEDCFDDETVRLELLDEGQSATPEMKILGANRIHKLLGSAITRTEYPSADPDVFGELKPIIYGKVEETRGFPVDAGALDALGASMTAGQTTIPLSDPDQFALFPSNGTVQIENEQISYTSKNAAARTLTGCIRGINSTITAAHDAGRTVWEIQAEYLYLVAAHACKSLTNVKVDGILQSSGFIVDLAGPTLIRFTGKPRRSLTVTVTTQPVHLGTVTAEQSPGAVSTTGEHGHNTAQGSHGHTVADRRTQYTTTGMPATFTISTTIFWPVAGTTPNYHCRVNVISGTWVLNGRTLTVGDNYWSPASAPANELLQRISGTGQVSIDQLDRICDVSVGSSSDPASGVAASLTGATTSAMATLGGSTAVSVSRVSDVVVSPAEIEVGRLVVCDVEGYADDGVGTYTGTPNALITNPADQIRHILAVQLGLTLSEYVDAPSFSQARSDFAAAGIRADWGLYDFLDSSELLERLRWSVAGRLFLNQEGKFKLLVLPGAGTPVKTITEADDVLGPASGGHPIRVGRSSPVTLLNRVVLQAKREIITGNYLEPVDVSDATSKTAYRTENTLLIENDFVRNATAATAIANKYLAWHKDVKWIARIPLLGLPTLHLELMDRIAITSARMPGGWTAKQFWIEAIERTLSPPGGQPDLCLLRCREV